MVKGLSLQKLALQSSAKLSKALGVLGQSLQAAGSLQGEQGLKPWQSLLEVEVLLKEKIEQSQALGKEAAELKAEIDAVGRSEKCR